ncbi:MULTISPECIES: hypothetical protein [unclassified Devosia]|uniref:hypothetical protein n=1 Tax=unclassified Devosia TaxID=196773 RepID=UPI00086E7C37|nr:MULTISPECIES: hypothetical protein [unclassified Devosia]MBN9360876.1 hypothetical protein [Devosia sp.]ODS88149.1 MAG: hypothetical protein ABS47_10355 [Devosia sp. SCN 66-27]OJX22822.1 MAG: hypothetical protein BGO83_18795 [Devosia sp. 66-14]
MVEATPETLHRLMKQAMDSGRAKTVDEAAALMEGYRIAIVFEGAQDALAQATLLTCVALASRVFLGGVYVDGDLDVPHITALPLPASLQDAARELGARLGRAEAGTPVITIGADGPRIRLAPFHIRTIAAGWRGGVVPVTADGPGVASETMPLAAMLAAALAVSEAFEFLSTGNGVAGRVPVGLSLWRPGANWFEADGAPILDYLPTRLWLIGLGHLGQAYLWALGLLPYREAGELELVLQDNDVIGGSTPSTSVLSTAAMEGKRKTRAMAAWAERRGFRTLMHERLFDAAYRRQPQEPSVALCGLDNAAGRRALDLAGFDFVVEAGLGRDHRNFQTIRLHTLPARRTAAAIWPDRGDATLQVEGNPAYQELLNSGKLDQCGVTLLAGRAVGAPFVGSVAACLAVAEVLRLLAGGQLDEVIDLDLRAVDRIEVVPHGRDFSTLNPGFTVCGH